MTMEKNNFSPCINKCKLDCFDVCLGCKRTKQEIAQWLYLNDQQKMVIIGRLNNIKSKNE